MAVEEWICTELLEDPLAVEKVRKRYGVKISDALARCIQENNAGSPIPDTVVFPDGSRSDVKLLLSYNKDDEETIYDAIRFFVENYDGRMLPFAVDSCGNYYCERNGQNIVYWTQEGRSVPVCNSFEDFIRNLTE